MSWSKESRIRHAGIGSIGGRSMDLGMFFAVNAKVFCVMMLGSVLAASKVVLSGILVGMASTALNGKLWDKLQIDPDPLDEEAGWYLMNCVVGSEMDLLGQAKHVTKDLPL